MATDKSKILQAKTAIELKDKLDKLRVREQKVVSEARRRLSSGS